MKMCEQILKNKTAAQYNSDSLNCKKQQDKSWGTIQRIFIDYTKTST